MFVLLPWATQMTRRTLQFVLGALVVATIVAPLGMVLALLVFRVFFHERVVFLQRCCATFKWKATSKPFGLWVGYAKSGKSLK